MITFQQFLEMNAFKGYMGSVNPIKMKNPLQNIQKPFIFGKKTPRTSPGTIKFKL